MKTLLLKKKIKYTGEQLKPLTNYLQHGLLGNSAVAWLGACDVSTEHMIDGEDLRAKETIAADEMVHFVIELFDVDLKAGVLLQRLMAEMVKTYLQKNSKSPAAQKLIRTGDDLYFEKKKLNISIATLSANSCLLHFAVNSQKTGAPVSILSLDDLGVKPDVFAKDILQLLQSEVVDVLEASQKVRTF
jgi:uncharacterized protein